MKQKLVKKHITSNLQGRKKWNNKNLQSFQKQESKRVRKRKTEQFVEIGMEKN